ncbi:MAG: AIR synthase related protein [Candidatus Altiarchaeota archaeon]
MDELPEKYVKGIEWIRDTLRGMDELAQPILGIGDWDDAACIEFKGKLVASTDGPYAKRLVMKSALIHAATDVLVKGARPIFALDNLIGSKADVEEMIGSLKEQAQAMDIPILGGNTFFEDSQPLCCITVLGKLETEDPIRDSGAQSGDIIALIGEPIWGERQERLILAKTMFDTWYEALKKVKFNSAKDVTKGGLVSVVYEMEKKSGRTFVLEKGIPCHMSRNLDNIIVTLKKKEYPALERICAKHGCALAEIGNVD